MLYAKCSSICSGIGVNSASFSLWEALFFAHQLIHALAFAISLSVFFQNITREGYIDMHRKHLLIDCLVVIF